MLATDRAVEASWACAIVLLLINLANMVFWAAGLHVSPYLLCMTALAGLAVCSVAFPLKGGWLVLTVIAFVLMILSAPLVAWDGRSIWFFHAKQIWSQGGLYAQLGHYAEWSHNDYPPLVPALAASLAAGVGYWNEVFPRLAVVIAVLPALMLFSLLVRKTWVYVAWLAGLMLLLVKPQGLLSGYMDNLLGLYCAAGVFLLAAMVETGERFRLDLRSGAFFSVMATLPFIKNEGIVAALILALILLLAYRGSLLAWASVAVSFLPWLVVWKLPVYTAGIQSDLFVGNLFERGLERAVDLRFYALLGHALNLSNVLLGAGIFIAIWAWRRNAARWRSVQAAFITVYLAAIIAIYLTTPHDIAWHFRTSAVRTFGIVVVVLFCFLFLEADRTGQPQDERPC